MLNKGTRSHSQYSSPAVALSYKLDTVIIPLVPFLKRSQTRISPWRPEVCVPSVIKSQHM